MSLKNKPKKRNHAIAAVVVLGAIGLAALVSGPTISEQVAEKRFNEDKKTALYNYSREMYNSGQENAPLPAFSTNEDLYNFVRAYSQDYSSKH